MQMLKKAFFRRRSLISFLRRLSRKKRMYEKNALKMRFFCEEKFAFVNLFDIIDRISRICEIGLFAKNAGVLQV
jgi:hypothetical protein